MSRNSHVYCPIVSRPFVVRSHILTHKQVPAGRYARSLRLILRRARRAKFIPAPTVPSSPKQNSGMLSGSTPSHGTGYPAFSPSHLINPAYYPTPPSGAAVSPGSMLFTAGPMINDSPSSATDTFEFDSIFAQETLERAGLTMGEGNQLPLYAQLTWEANVFAADAIAQIP